MEWNSEKIRILSPLAKFEETREKNSPWFVLSFYQSESRRWKYEKRSVAFTHAFFCKTKFTSLSRNYERKKKNPSTTRTTLDRCSESNIERIGDNLDDAGAKVTKSRVLYFATRTCSRIQPRLGERRFRSIGWKSTSSPIAGAIKLHFWCCTCDSSSMSVSRFPLLSLRLLRLSFSRKLGFLEFIRIHSPVSTILRDTATITSSIFLLALGPVLEENRIESSARSLCRTRTSSNPRSRPPAFLYNRNQLIDPPSNSIPPPSPHDVGVHIVVRNKEK